MCRLCGLSSHRATRDVRRCPAAERYFNPSTIAYLGRLVERSNGAHFSSLADVPLALPLSLSGISVDRLNRFCDAFRSRLLCCDLCLCYDHSRPTSSSCPVRAMYDSPELRHFLWVSATASEGEHCWPGFALHPRDRHRFYLMFNEHPIAIPDDFDRDDDYPALTMDWAARMEDAERVLPRWTMSFRGTDPPPPPPPPPPRPRQPRRRCTTDDDDVVSFETLSAESTQTFPAPVSAQTMSSSVDSARRRIANTAKLELVCAVCDSLVPTKDIVVLDSLNRAEDETAAATLDAMRARLQPPTVADHPRLVRDLPPELVQEYDVGRPWLAGCMLSIDGFEHTRRLDDDDAQDEVIHDFFYVCWRCYDALQKDTRVPPKFAIANGFYYGRTMFPDMTYVEQLLVSKVWSRARVVLLRKGPGGHRMRELNSHMICYRNEVSGRPTTILNEIVPRLPTPDDFFIVFDKRLDETTLSRDIGVSMEKLLPILEFLTRHNHRYADMDHSRIEQALDELRHRDLLDELGHGIDPDIIDEAGLGDDDGGREQRGDDASASFGSPPTQSHYATLFGAEQRGSDRLVTMIDEQTVNDLDVQFVLDNNVRETTNQDDFRRFRAQPSRVLAECFDTSILAEQFPELFPYGRVRPLGSGLWGDET